MPPPVAFGRKPYLGGKKTGLRILHDTTGIGRNAFAATTVPAHLKTVELPVRDRIRREFSLPVVRAGLAFQRKAVRQIPAGEIAYKPDLRGIRRPFAENPPSGSPVKPIVFMGGRPIGKSLPPGKAFCEPLYVGGAPLYGVAKRLEPGIVKQSGISGLSPAQCVPPSERVFFGGVAQTRNRAVPADELQHLEKAGALRTA